MECFAKFEKYWFLLKIYLLVDPKYEIGSTDMIS